MDPGQRDRLIIFERATTTVGTRGGETEAWVEHARAYAKVLFGTGQERRDAAQQGSAQAATFITLWSPTLAGVTAKDRISFDGSIWNIAGPPAQVGFHSELHFTATRSA